MAEEGAEQQDKTEAPSPRRLQRARESGQVPISRELVTFGALAAGCSGIMILGDGVGRDLATQLAGLLGNIDSSRLAGPLGVRVAARAAFSAVFLLILPVMIAGALVLVQSRLAFRWDALQFKLKHLSPIAGFHRIVGRDALIEAAKSVLKTCLVVYALWSFRSSSEAIAKLALQSPQSIPASLAQSLYGPIIGVLLLQALVAAFDLLWVRFQHSSRLKMSQQDLREELKEAEGDPKVRSRLKQLRLQRAKKRMLAQVPKATVVITNPTHYAVALFYNRDRHAAPRILAKGVDEVAARIREVARDNGVPLLSNPPLARALFRIDLDAEIPSEQYQAVAEVIAYVWKLKSRVSSDAFNR